MSVRLRLARGGTKKRPIYRVVATQARSPRDGRFLERVGTYNPLLPSDAEDRVVLNEERIRYWLGNGAKPSDRVARFLDGAGITENTVRLRGTGKRAKEIEAKKAEAAAEAAKNAPPPAAAAPAAAAATPEPAAEAPVAEAVTPEPAAKAPPAETSEPAQASAAEPPAAEAAAEAPTDAGPASDEGKSKAVPPAEGA
jgi:small subunit ribosomal protein S16